MCASNHCRSQQTTLLIYVSNCYQLFNIQAQIEHHPKYVLQPTIPGICASNHSQAQPSIHSIGNEMLPSRTATAIKDQKCSQNIEIIIVSTSICHRHQLCNQLTLHAFIVVWHHDQVKQCIPCNQIFHQYHHQKIVNT